MKVLNLQRTYIDVDEIKEIFPDRKFRTIVFAGIDSNGNVCTHFQGAEPLDLQTITYEWCGLLKHLENRISNKMSEIYEF
jgi:hypothetical protein